MALELNLEYDLFTATFYHGQNIQFIGKTKKRFWRINWTLFDQSGNVIAFYRLRQKPLHPGCKLLVEFLNEGKKNDLILYYKVWKAPHVQFEYDGDQFLIVFHIGNCFSFFKNDNQFAFFQKQKISINENKKHKIVADADTSAKLIAIISYAILIITEDEFEQASDFNIDLGNLGPELKKVDLTWKAKII